MVLIVNPRTGRVDDDPGDDEREEPEDTADRDEARFENDMRRGKRLPGFPEPREGEW